MRRTWLPVIWLIVNPGNPSAPFVYTTDPAVEAAAAKAGQQVLVWPNVAAPTMVWVPGDFSTGKPPQLLAVSGAMIPTSTTQGTGSSTPAPKTP